MQQHRNPQTPSIPAAGFADAAFAPEGPLNSGRHQHAYGDPACLYPRVRPGGTFGDGARISPEGAWEPTPGFTLGKHPFPRFSPEGAAETATDAFCRPFRPQPGRWAIPKVNPGLRSPGPLGRKAALLPPSPLIHNKRFSRMRLRAPNAKPERCSAPGTRRSTLATPSIP